MATHNKWKISLMAKVNWKVSIFDKLRAIVSFRRRNNVLNLEKILCNNVLGTL